ncbi:cation diffusion facilitator family transporter [Salegentibacter salegens]|uniref:Cobalt-zinc-cadmium efflux system protein n=1 Tax=Salegentibacter salegens TaxID=143223 RepID=A0A1M7LKW6_9FLAO|nr:cation diffusion facilitator family transporter [Salegentibacter salegens]PRX50710.1 cobalt-zinc-cadmium efflux system protein [Salegentibacter salegens]SHM78680.1 cobalt-zinc-cadmium efflux system protein [Salegentibacter salegens]
MGHHHHKNSSEKNLRLVFFLNLGFTIIEFIGGIYVNSIAIISDAVHDLGDSLSLGTSWYLDHKSQQKSDSKFSFGYRRFSLLGALLNSLILIAGSVYVIYEAVGRLMAPEHSDAEGMMIFAFIGVAVNGFAAWKLSSGKTLNEKVISWHLMEDVLGWASILVVAIILQFKDIHYLDPALSLVITLYILWNVFKRLKETLFIFLQGTPSDINLEEVKQQIEEIPGVASSHHVHIWSQEGEHHVFTAHVKLQNVNSVDEYLNLKSEVLDSLKTYNFEHFTIQFELDSETCSLE